MFNLVFNCFAAAFMLVFIAVEQRFIKNKRIKKDLLIVSVVDGMALIISTVSLIYLILN